MTEEQTAQQGREEGQEEQKKGGKYSLLILIGLYIYLALLITGVVAEVFDIQWILDWWIWRPPGKPAPN